MTEQAKSRSKSDLQAAPKYWAFISYSHQDEAWGKWLHKALEKYRVPKQLVGRKSPAGKVPKRVFPVFRDREELPSSSSLSQKINEALEQSRYLVVICSPKAAASKWVNEEVRIFKAMGREDRVLCLIVEGEPNATDRANSGQLECFPETVRFRIGPDGQLTRERTEPLAADVRQGKDSKVNAKLRLLAGILGVDFDELKQRDKQRRFWQRVQLSVVTVVMMLIIAGVWFSQRRATEEQRQIALARSLVAQSQTVFEKEPLLGLRLALEGWALVRHEAPTVRVALESAIGDLAQYGRFLHLGADVEAIYANPLDPTIFLVDRAAADELRRTLDGSLIATLSGPVETVTFNPTAAGSPWLIQYGDDTPAELRRAGDGAVLAKLSGLVSDVDFSLDAATSYMAVYYEDNHRAELRRTADGSAVPLSGQLGTVLLAALYPCPYSVVGYQDQTPGELRLLADNSIVPLPGSVSWMWCDAPSYVVSYKDDQPSELRRADGALIAVLSGSDAHVTFSPDASSTYFVVAYRGDLPGELRRTTDGALVVELTKPVADFLGSVVFSPTAEVFAVIYGDGSSELRRAADGSLITTLPDNLFGVTFSQDGAAFIDDTNYQFYLSRDGSRVPLSGPTTSSFVPPGVTTGYLPVIYQGDQPGELRRTDDGAILETLPSPVNELVFSNDEGYQYFVPWYGNDVPGELRRTSDGGRIATLSGPLAYVGFPDTAATHFIVGYTGRRNGELRRTSDGGVVATLSGPVVNTIFNPGRTVEYFIVTYADQKSELWQVSDRSHHLATLDLGLARDTIQRGFRHAVVFSVLHNRLIMRYVDGRAYLLDLVWLSKMGGRAQEMPIEELVKLVCEGPFADRQVWTESAEARLKEYLGSQAPRACQSAR